jgi:hypothetical protein
MFKSERLWKAEEASLPIKRLREDKQTILTENQTFKNAKDPKHQDN